MTKHQDLDDIYRLERRRIQGLSAKALAKRKAALEEIVERATRDLVENLKKTVAMGGMTAEEAAEYFAAFTLKVNSIRGPSEPN